jgi:hypothetical protein
MAEDKSISRTMAKARTNLGIATILIHFQAEFNSFLLSWNLHQGEDPLGHHLLSHFSRSACHHLHQYTDASGDRGTAGVGSTMTPSS